MIGAIVIGHGQLAQTLVDTVFSIVGNQHNVVAISNKALSMDSLKDLIKAKLDELGETVVFTDLPGGSCTIACKSLKVPVITGVNLPMLLEFMLVRDKLCLDDLVKTIKNTGKESIQRI